MCCQVFHVMNCRLHFTYLFKMDLQKITVEYVNCSLEDCFFLISGVVLWVLRPLTGLLYQSRLIGDGDCEEIGGLKIGRGNRSSLLGENLPQRYFVHHKSHMPRPGFEPWRTVVNTIIKNRVK
jgi:hypothetical protein